MEGHSPFRPAPDGSTRQGMINSMKTWVKQAGLAANPISSAAEDLGLADVNHNGAIRVLGGYEAFASVVINWGAGLWLHSEPPC